MMHRIQRRALIVACSVMAAGLITGCGDETKTAGNTAADLPTVGIVQLVEHEALDAANRGIVDALAERGYVDGKTVHLDRQNAQADQSNLHNIAVRFVSGKDKLIFAIATPAVQAVAGQTKTIPVVGTAVTNFEVARLVKSDAHPGGNVTGVSDINPVADQLALLKALVPGLKTVGTIYNSSEINAEYQIRLLKDAALKDGITVVESTVSTVNDLQQAVLSLKGKVDALYLPTDNVVSSGLPILLKTALPAKLPIVAGEGAQVKAGCLASIGVDYYGLGLMTGRMGADILDGKAKPADMPIQTQSSHKVLINLKTAKAIGLTIPEALLTNAETIE